MNTPANEEYNHYFLQGIFFLYNNQLENSYQCFLDALKNTSHTDIFYNKYLSYLGLVEALRNSKGGMLHSYEAISSKELTVEILLNHSIVQYTSGFRKRCINSLETGLTHKPNDKHLLKFYKLIGKRRYQRVSTHKRLRPLIGRLLRKRAQNIQGELFEFIREVVYREYHKIKPSLVSNQ